MAVRAQSWNTILKCIPISLSANQLMRHDLLNEGNDSERTFAVFFYGLNMDADLLSSKGVVPRDARVVFIEGLMVKLGDKAMLLRSPNSRAHGMLFRLTHREMGNLYKDLHDYSAEPFLAISANGGATAVVSMVHINPPIDSTQNPEYASRWNALALRLGLPSAAPTILGVECGNG